MCALVCVKPYFEQLGSKSWDGDGTYQEPVYYKKIGVSPTGPTTDNTLMSKYLLN